MKFALALLALARTVTAQDPKFATCDGQATCMEFTIEEKGGTDCEDTCYYEVCMIYANFEGCVKSGDPYSHTCVKDPAVCQDATGFAGAAHKDDGEAVLKAAGTQCQKVAPGATAEFYIKDGNDSCGDHTKYYTLDNTYTAACEDLLGLPDVGCAGNGVQNACVWRVKAPLDCTEAPIVTDAPELITTTPGATTTTTTATTTTTPADGVTTPATTTTTTTPAVTDPTTTGNTPSDAGGDPHFARWGREHDSFHGECDLVLVHSEDFHNGAGFDLHARTTIQDYFSYIETAALRVGDNTLEFYHKNFYLNGVEMTPDDLPITFGGDYKYTITNADVEQGKNAHYYQYYKVDLHQDSSILFKFYKQYLTMSLSGNPKDFSDAKGLLGQFPSGDMISRDGTPFSDFTSYGFEWQVNPDDGMLFRDARAPQLPFEQCRLPTAARPVRRALRTDRKLLGEATKACAHVAGNGFELCVDDVMTTGDAGIAGTW